MSEWTEKKIGEVMNVQRGGSPRPIKKYLTDSPDGLNWIKIGDASETDKYIYATKEKITKDGLHKTRLVEEGDFLLSNSMSFGRPYIMKTRGCIHDGWLVLKDKEEEQIDKDFLYYYLSSPVVFAQFDKLAAGSTVRNLNIRLVSSVEIPIPPLPEQKRIVAILDEAFEAIDQAKANIERNIENAEELFQSHLEKVFKELLKQDEINYRLKDVCEYDKVTNDKIGIPYVGLADIESDTGRFIGDLTPREMKSRTFYFNEEHLLYGRLRPYLNKILIPDFEGHCSTEIFPVKTSKLIFKSFLFYWFLKPTTVNKIDKTSTGARMPRANMDEVIDFEIPVPGIDVQKELVNQLVKIKEKSLELTRGYKNKKVQLEELKKSILQKAFSGELTANEHVAV